MPNEKQSQTPNQKKAPGVGGLNDGSGRGQQKADQEIDHDSKREQTHPNTQRESKKDV